MFCLGACHCNEAGNGSFCVNLRAKMMTNKVRIVRTESNAKFLLHEVLFRILWGPLGIWIRRIASASQ